MNPTKILFLSALMLACAARVPGQGTSVPMSMRTVVPVSDTKTEDPEADRAHEALWSAWRAKPPEGVTRTNRAYWEWQDKVFKQFAEDALSFAEKYPKDPRRWEAIVQRGFTPPWFITGFKPEFDTRPGQANLEVDEVALAAFKARQSKLNREVMLADETTPRQRVGALGWMITEATAAARKDGKQPDLAQFEPLMVEVATQLPDERGATLLRMYLDVLRASAPETASELEAKLESKPIGKAMKELAAKQELAQEKSHEDMVAKAADMNALKFTAADGREVDLSKMRGKVVLIDFWATWCGPCINELPNVLENYSKYHDQGFEIVGISLENPSLAEGDSAEAKEKKLYAAKKKMLDFTKNRNMPWPQYFDGKYWQNDYAVKYGVRAIPATFLLDKEGKIASTTARGPELENQLKKLLGK